MKTLETQIEQQACRQILLKHGIKSIKLTPTQATGYPDRLFFIPGGKPLLIEFKRPGEAPRPKQRHIIQWLKKLGYQVAVCDSVESATMVVRRIITRLSLGPPR